MYQLLTQTKGYLKDEYRYKIGNRLYGCDTCQQVCPKNRGINTTHEDIILEPEILKPRLVPLLQMSNKEFKILMVIWQEHGEVRNLYSGMQLLHLHILVKKRLFLN